MKDESILKDLSRQAQANASAPLAQPFGIGTRTIAEPAKPLRIATQTARG